MEAPPPGGGRIPDRLRSRRVAADPGGLSFPRVLEDVAAAVAGIVADAQRATAIAQTDSEGQGTKGHVSLLDAALRQGSVLPFHRPQSGFLETRAGLERAPAAR